MTVDVKLSVSGHLDVDAIRGALTDAGYGPVEFSETNFETPVDTMPMHGVFSLVDPGVRKNSRDSRREIRMHHGIGSGDMPHVIGDEYSYLVMGAHAGGPDIMKSLAERFGGKFENEADETQDRIYDASAPSPGP